MIEAGLGGVEFMAVNTDLQALKGSPAHNAMQIGAQLTKGLGSGGDPSRGRAAAEEDRETIANALAGADMVFVTAGMGGGTGTGAAPVIADIARNQGALTVGIVTKPFKFEGSVRMKQALEGIERLREAVDTLIIIPNERLLEVVPPSTSMREAFRIADNVLYEATRGIYEIISRHDHVNLDFADVRTVMKGMGEAMMGTGRAEGENRAVEAAKAAISSPLLENVDISGSQAVLVNVLGREVGLQDTAAAMEYIQEAAGPQAHVIFGYGTDDSMGDTLQVTVIATGFHSSGAPAASRLAQATAPAAHEAPASAEATREAEPVLADEPEPAAEPEAVLEAEPVREEPPVPEAELAPEAELECESEAAPEREPEPEPEPEPELMTAPEPEALSEAAPPPLMAMEAADGGGAPYAKPELREHAEPQAAPPRTAAWTAPAEPVRHADLDGFLTRRAPEPPAPERAETNRANAQFLSPAGSRNIAEVEVPDGEPSERPLSRGTSSSLGPDNRSSDLSAPAYTRKYMD
jgi:cell division protein FtsZ